jgi:cytochrome c-type biogenesis protein CcmF
MTYTGEHPIPGLIGHILVAIALVSALLSFFTYGMASFQKEEELKLFWRKRGRQTFLVTAFASFGFIATLFYLLVQQYFEYLYVWDHSNTAMDFRYILVCFWGGQEGSFMLWIFWHVLIGLFLMRKSKEWEPEVMAVFALVQVFLASMLLGIYVGDHHIGIRLHCSGMATAPFQHSGV